MQGKILKPHFANMREVFKVAVKELLVPYPSVQLNNWNFFNKFVGGFRSKEYTIVCGPTGAGKTTLLANISAQLLVQGVKHYVASVETGPYDYMKRILSVWEGNDINTGDAVPKEEVAKIALKYSEIIARGNLEFGLYENRISLDQMISDLQYMNKEMGCRIAFIDNLNFLMEVTKSQDVNYEIDRVTHELIMFCKSADMHVVMVMHPRKTDEGRVLSEFDIKGSSTAVQEAQNVFLYNRPDPEDIKNGVRVPSDRELRLQKMRRRGKYERYTIVFNSSGTKFSEAGYKSSYSK